MRRYFAPCAVVLSLTALSLAGYAQEDVTEKVHLINVLPAEMMKALNALKGLPVLHKLTAEDSENALILSGSKDALTRFKAEIQKRDVAPRQVLIKMRLLKISVAADGTRKEEMLQSPILSTIDNMPGSIGVSDQKDGKTTVVWKCSAIPHLDENAMVTLSVTVQKVAKSVTVKRRVHLGTTTLFTGFTDSKDKKIQEAVAKGIVPEKSGAFVAEMLEVTPTEIPANVSGTLGNSNGIP